MDTARLFSEVGGLSLRDAAVHLARAGVPVFPCVPGAKNPLVEHGFREATVDLPQVSTWWRRWPGCSPSLG